VASLALAPLGCQVCGERRPSQTLGARSGGTRAAPPGFAAQHWAPPDGCAGALPPQALAVSDLEAYQHERYAVASTACTGPEAGWGSQWWEGGWMCAPAGAGPAKPAANSSLSPDAEVFVPQSRNWDGIYQ